MALRAFSLACSIPWAITPEALQQILEISIREHLPDFEAVAAKRSRRMDGSESARVREGGVAVINITGPIFRYADFFTDISGGATIDSLSKDFAAALSDPSVSSILLNIDSPGGEVAGVNEFAQMVFDARDRKPIVAYVDGLGASAAYWIASAAHEIVADATGMIGSIGVVAAIPNPDKRSAREVEFVSSQSPKKRPNPNTESGKDQIQALVDDLADVFVSTVARNRGVGVKTVLGEFGQGAVLVGQKAVDAGLADRLGSFEQVVSDLAAGKKPRRYRPKTVAETEQSAEVEESVEAEESAETELSADAAEE
jgi:signal peptide peptidase SppA